MEVTYASILEILDCQCSGSSSDGQRGVRNTEVNMDRKRHGEVTLKSTKFTRDLYAGLWTGSPNIDQSSKSR